jgi:hypothetical protein
MQTAFHQTERTLTNVLYDSGMEQKILKHWRTYEPKRVEELVSRQMLKKALISKANDLIDLQIQLEKTEMLDPTLAKMEAWNRLMRSEEDAKEEAEAWGMTLEEYLNRP